MSKEMEIAAPASGCILKIKVRKYFSQLAAYCASHATDMEGRPTKEAIFTNMTSKLPRELSREVGFCFRMRPNKLVNTGHLIIAPSVPFRNQDDLEDAISIALEEHGLTGTPYAVWYHGEEKEKHPHAHICFSLIDYAGQSVKLNHSYRTNERAARKIEARFPYLGKLSMKPKEDTPRNNEKPFAAMRREERVLGTGTNGKQSADLEVNQYDTEKPHANLQPKKGKRKMTASQQLTDLAGKIKTILEDDEVADLETFEERVNRETGAGIEWWRRPSGDSAIAGWSLVLSGGTKLKGSDIARAFSFKKIVAALEENERKRRVRMRQFGAEADAMAATSMALAKAAKGAAGAVLTPGARAVVQPTPPMPGAKPDLKALQGQGVQITGYKASRGECLDADSSVWRWEYRRDGADQVAFVDLGDSLEIHDGALEDSKDVDAFLLAAKARFGSTLTLADAPAKGEFLELLAQAAERHSVEVIDGRTGRPVGASQRHREPSVPVPAPQDEFRALEDLGAAHEADLALLDALDLGLPSPLALKQVGPVAGMAGAASEGAVPVEVRVVEEGDLAGRRAVAARVKALGEGLPPVPAPAVAAAMDGPSLRSLHAAYARMEPVRIWAEVTSSRMEKDSFLAHGDALALVQRAQEREASRRGKPLQTAVARDAEAKARADLVAARKGMEGLGLLERGAEAVTGTRAKEVERLEGEVQRCARATLAAQRQFQQQLESDEKGRAALAQMQERIDTYWAEQGAMHAPWVQHLAAALSGLLAKVWGWVTGLERKEQDEAGRARDRQEMIQEAREAEASGGGGGGSGGGSGGSGDGQEQARRDRGRGG